MNPDALRKRAEEERAKARCMQSAFAKAMHLQLAEQFERRADWPEQERQRS